MSALRRLTPTLVVLEATGGLELAVAALRVAGPSMVVVHARQVRGFARATGLLAKTDRLDAVLLAHFAEASRPAPSGAARPRFFLRRQS